MLEIAGLTETAAAGFQCEGFVVVLQHSASFYFQQYFEKAVCDACVDFGPVSAVFFGECDGVLDDDAILVFTDELFHERKLWCVRRAAERFP